MKTGFATDIQLFAGETTAGESMTQNAAAAGGEPNQETVGTETEERSSDVPAKEKNAPPLSDTDVLRAVKASLEESEKSSRINGVIGQWKKDAEELKSIYPGFVLEKELKTPGMEQLLTAGVPLRRAFEVLNLESIIGTAMRYASLNAGKRTADALMMQKSRPQENGVLDRASSVKRTDVKSLTEKDIIRILSEVSRGAKISFN